MSESLCTSAARVVLGATALVVSLSAASSMAHIPGGGYVPLYTLPAATATRGATTAPVRSTRRTVGAFEMDVYPVTNGEFLAFVREHPQWQRSKASRLFVDDSYLRHWRGDLDLGDNAPERSPVVYVSWFAARAFLKAEGKALPTVDQWEYVAAADERRADASRDRAFHERLRIWYGRPTPARLPPVGATIRNVYGVHDIHALVWEWTLDFNSTFISGESRADAARDRTLYCGSGAVNASAFEDYAAFMRYAFRSSLQARYGVANLGFRGVRNLSDRRS
jgi:formylglycine-generating enzyme required for sulfatase activity